MRRLLLLLNIMVLLVLLVVVGYVAVLLTWDRTGGLLLGEGETAVLPTSVPPANVHIPDSEPPSFSNGPTLTIPSLAVEPSQGVAQVPVNFTAAATAISSLLFSLDYDQTAFQFDGRDADGDGVPDGIQLNLPTDFTAIVSVDVADVDGEIDIAIFDATPPFTPLSDGNLFYLTLMTTAETRGQVGFSTQPNPSFGDVFGQRVLGRSQGGVVCVGSCADFEPAEPSSVVEQGGVVVAQALGEGAGEETAVSTPPPMPTAEPLPTAVPTCENLLVNGNFEGSDGWEIDQTTFTASYVSTLVHAGRQALRLGIPMGAENLRSFSAVRQTVSLPLATESAMLRFWLYPFGEVAAGEGDYQYVTVVGGNGEKRPLIAALNHTQQWEQHSFDLTSYAGQTITLQFGVFNDGSDGSTGLYLDDAELMLCHS